MDSIKVYSRKDAANALGISERHLTNLIARGEIKFVRIGRRTGISATDLGDYVRQNTSGGRRGDSAA
jgi:excisionase family DNA binding protein